jgi:hypothetical protein
MAKLTTGARNNLATGVFALPGRRFPVNDKRHAIVAKSYASQMYRKGTLSGAQKAKVDRKANAKLAR